MPCRDVIDHTRFPYRAGGYRLVLGAVSYWRKAGLVVPPLALGLPSADLARRTPHGDGPLRAREALRQPGSAAVTSVSEAGAADGAAVRRRMSAVAAIARTASPISAEAPNSVSRVPTSDAIGPTTAKPIGISTHEPSASYEETRESASRGTCCWSDVSQ